MQMRAKISIGILWTALLSMNAAHATYYVNDDAPVITVANPFEKNKENISFNGLRISKAGRMTLQKMIDAAIAANMITINAYGKTRTQFNRAKQRVAAIKSWMVKHGVTDAKIKTYTEVNPNNDANNNTVQITLHTQITAIAPMRDAHLSTALSNTTTAQLPSPIPAAHASEQPTTPAPKSVPATDLPRSWILTANKSLRDNLDDWAKIAGYTKPEWAATNPYKITYTSTYTGTFLDVLNQISAIVPTLDFQVSKSHHTLRVLDAER